MPAALELRGFSLHALSDVEDLVPGRGEHHALALALEQAHRQLALELGDPPGHGGVVHVEEPTGLTHVSLPRDGQEKTQIVPVHLCIFAHPLCTGQLSRLRMCTD